MLFTLFLVAACNAADGPQMAPSPTEPKVALETNAPTETPETKPAVDSRCSTWELALADTPWGQVAPRLCDLCSTPEQKASREGFCDAMNSPFGNDIPSCEHLDVGRNTIFAANGLVFETTKWQEHFGKMDWYKPNPGFDPAHLSDVAKANVAEILRMAEAYGCDNAR